MLLNKVCMVVGSEIAKFPAYTAQGRRRSGDCQEYPLQDSSRYRKAMNIMTSVPKR